jgi:peptidoglycan/LPS O-acetylase OafA/YrhL
MIDIRSHTSLRGIAAVLVVAFHYAVPLRDVGFDVNRYTIVVARGYLWVDLFFILSGYILCHVYSHRLVDITSISLFFRARFARIYPLHIATLLLLVGCQIALPLMAGASINFGKPDTLWLNVFDIHAWGMLTHYDWNFPSWSISAEFAAYLLFPIICIGMRFAPTTTFSVLASVVVARVIFVSLTPPRYHFEQLALFECLPMFALGIILYRSRQFSLRSSFRMTSAFQLVSLVGIVFAMHFGLNDASLIFPFALLIFSTQADAGAAGRLLTSGPLVMLGEWSFSIYMIHIPVLFILQMAWQRIAAQPLGLSAPAAMISLVLASAVSTAILGCLSFNYFEKPIRDWLRPRMRTSALQLAPQP